MDVFLQECLFSLNILIVYWPFFSLHALLDNLSSTPSSLSSKIKRSSLAFCLTVNIDNLVLSL